MNDAELRHELRAAYQTMLDAISQGFDVDADECETICLAADISGEQLRDDLASLAEAKDAARRDELFRARMAKMFDDAYERRNAIRQVLRLGDE